MALTFRPLDSFLGVDLKLGASLIALLGLLNKVAGVYGILAVFTGGTFAQVSLYVYSVATLLLFLWGLRAIGEEHPNHILHFAHAFTLDHFVSTTYTALFGVIWWVYTPHDGRREAHSEAQKAILENASMSSNLTEADQQAAAQAVWASERGFALMVIILGWILKIYFILCLYSFALHIRRGTFKQIAMIRDQGNVPASRRAVAYNHLPQDSLSAAQAEELEMDLSTPSKPQLRIDSFPRYAKPLPDVEEPFTPTTAPAADPPIQLPFGSSSAAMIRSRSTDDRSQA